MGKNKKSMGRRELTLTRIILHHNKKFIGAQQKIKEMVRIGQKQTLPLFGPG
jgi:hypothetical protein